MRAPPSGLSTLTFLYVHFLHTSQHTEKAMAPHSSTLAWQIPWTEEPGRLQSMGSLRVGHDFTFTFTFRFHALEKEMATHSSVLAWRIPGTGEPGGLPSMGSAKSRTRLKRLSSNPSNDFILCCPLFFCPQSFPASGSFPVSQLSASGGQSIVASFSISLSNEY